MANRGATTFLKRQKEQQRVARALAKRVAKQARREARANATNVEEPTDDELSMMPTDENSPPDEPAAD